MNDVPYEVYLRYPPELDVPCEVYLYLQAESSPDLSGLVTGATGQPSTLISSSESIEIELDDTETGRKKIRERVNQDIKAAMRNVRKGFMALGRRLRGRHSNNILRPGLVWKNCEFVIKNECDLNMLGKQVRFYLSKVIATFYHS